MISIIICSRYSYIKKELEYNIKNTIGNIQYEIICVDNTSNKYSICQAYNEGVRRSRYPYLCFMHEDVSFLTENWGIKAIEHFSDKNIWMLGVLGTKYFCRTSTYWWHTPSCVGHNWNGKVHKIFHNPLRDECVVMIDGVWMFTKKQIFTDYSIEWDENSFKGFDFYDMDICMQICTHGGNIKTISSIEIDHKSEGNYSGKFHDNCILFHNKWDKFLPISTTDTEKECSEVSDRIALERICQLEKFHYNTQEKEGKVIYKIINKLYNFYNSF